MAVDIIIVALVPLRDRPKYISITQAAGAVGLVSGTFLGAVVVQRASFRMYSAIHPFQPADIR